MQQAWAERLFDHRKLTTTEGRPLGLIDSGLWNPNQGPDFLHGRIVLDGMEIHGDIELHLDSRDWFRHGHHVDRIYDGVVLHVVMDRSPCDVFRSDGSKVPTMSLQGRVPEKLGIRAEKRAGSRPAIPCEIVARQYPAELVGRMLEEKGMQRVNEKLGKARLALERAGNDWEEAVWREMMAVVAGPVNAEAFRELASTVSYKIVRRYAHRPLALEAMLFGTAGMIQAREEELREEWAFLAMKHFLGIQFVPLRKHRMHPASFPDIRLSQAADLIQKFPVLTDILGVSGYERLREAVVRSASPETGTKALGSDLKATLAINVLLPFGAVFQEAHGWGDAIRMFSEWLMAVPPESNKITRKFLAAGWKPRNALESQGMISLDRQGCSAFGCLGCPVWCHR